MDTQKYLWILIVDIYLIDTHTYVAMAQNNIDPIGQVYTQT